MPGDDANGSLTNFSMAATPATDAPTNLPQGPGIAPMTTEEREKPKLPTETWSDEYAAKIALGDFKRAEGYRTINHDWRFRVSDQLYLAWTQRRTWEGTKIPRSSVGIFLALEQIEALLPSVVLSLFPDNNRLPFDVEPEPSTTPAQADAVRDLISWQLQDIGEPGKYLSLREVARRAYKQSYIYGNGIVEFGVLDRNITRNHFTRTQVPVRQTVAHPLTGEPVAVPTGQFRSIVQKRMQMQHVVRPMLSNVDIRDFYWDPNCNSHNINDGGFCATRHLMSVNRVMEFAKTEGFNIPSATQLLRLAQIKTMTQGDSSKMNLEAFRGMTYQPTIDYSVDPALAQLEVIRYWQANRHVWLLGRQWVAYNQPNQFGMLPFLDAFYVDVPSRFAGLSICDLVEGDQKLAEAIVNARIDELNLMIHRPLIVKEGRAFSASQQRLRPGVVWKVEDPANDIKWMDSQPVTQDAYIEVQALEQRVQKKTGVTDLAVLGTPASGGNSANRTATGVSTQEGASGKRIQYHVENAEDQFIVPALNIIHALNQVFLPLDEMQQVLGPEGSMIQVDPVDVMNAGVRFRMNASSKLKIKAALAQGGLGILIQTLLNPDLDKLAFVQGVRLDLKQVTRIINDTFSLPPQALWVPMEPEYKQTMMQLNMMQFQMKMQEQQQRLQSHQQVATDRDETQLIKALIDRIMTPDVAHKLLNEYADAGLTLPSDQPPASPNGNGAGASGGS
jgi:hypothetical protein